MEGTTQVSDVIDISQLQNNTEAVEMDGSANAFARSTPLRDGKYRGVLQPPSNAEDKKNMIHKRAFKSGDNKGKEYFVVDFEEQLMEYFEPGKNSDELLGKQKNFDKSASTMVRHVDGKPTCEIATLLTAMGFNIQGKVTQEQLVKTFVEALERKPQVGFITEVNGRYDSGKPLVNETTKEVIRNKKGDVVNEWKTAFRGEASLKRNPDGSIDYNVPPVKVKVGNEEVSNRVFVNANVIDYFRLS